MKKITVEEIRKVIDYTLLSPNATIKDYDNFFVKAKKYGFRRIFVAPFCVKRASQELPDIIVGTTSGFPHGNESIETKVFSARKSIENGALEIDFVMNIGSAIEGDFHYLEKEFKSMSSLKSEVGDPRFNVKVILETCFLSPDVIKKVVNLASDCGLDFVKTSTGFGPRGASVDDVKLMKEAAGSDIKIKASGGIRTLNQVLEFLKAGAERIGTSAGDQILLEAAAVLPE
ncbi:MAG: deoxyribose-phosphate aldolase [Actinobacteria bacterium]|nr:deoxyribose-phosphate aldolase [Actinomycetota bacterium]